MNHPDMPKLLESLVALCRLEEDDIENLSTKGFLVVKQLSGGACSMVYLCHQTKSNIISVRKEKPKAHSSGLRMIVCKVMEAVRAPKDFIQKFLPRELANIDRLRSGRLPHVIHTTCILQYKTKIFVMMRYAERGNLTDYIRENEGDLPESLVKFWFRQLAVALAYLHKLEIVHRDIKCDNILITGHFNVKLSDFGFSRLNVDQKGKQVFSTTFCGSLGYAAPELLKGIPYNPKLADMWSMGVVLFIMLNGSMPFNQSSIIHLYQAQNKKDYKFRKSVLNKITPPATKLVERMLEPNWFERITSNDVLSCTWLANAKGAILKQNEEEIMARAEQLKNRDLLPMKDIIKKNVQSNEVEFILAEEEDIASEEEYSSEDKSKSSKNKISVSNV